MFRPVLFAALLCSASAAIAGDKPLYAPAPDWVKPGPPIDAAMVSDSAPVFLILDNQQRIKGDEVDAYYETAARAASTEVLGAIGTIKLPWQPDKGDLIVHKAEIIRGAEHIDLLAGAGEKFTVLHREEQLEQRTLTGLLTATMAVEGLRVGDVLRVSFSITQKDAALKGNVQAFLPLVADPVRIQFARARLIWPQDANLHYKVYADGAQPQPVLVGGYRELNIPLPLAKQPDMPDDAPSRYKRPPIVEATSFADWQSISKVMAPLYATDELIAPGSPLAAEVTKITTAESDPLKRAALALQLVQDKVRYLFKGMDGGNYVPQTPIQTWNLRYGDCKAKTLLLLSLLHAMNIEAEPILASSQFGDLVPYRLPSPGAFDHVLVHATINGDNLWLDGTSGGDRLADIHDSVPFGNVLPIRMAGAALLPIPVHADARPQVAAILDLDQTAGVDFPAPFTLDITVRGQTAQLFRAAQAQGSKDEIAKAAQQIANNYIGSGTIVSRAFTFDDAAGTATLTTRGVTYPGWTKEEERYRSTLDHTLSGTTFAPDRARPSWQNIPFAMGDAHGATTRTRIRLPDGGKGFTLEGDQSISETLAGNRVVRATTLTDGVITTEDTVMPVTSEIAATDIATAREKLDRAKEHLLKVVAPVGYPAPHEVVDADKRAHRFDAILAVYKQDVTDQPGKAEPLTNRAWFLNRIYDWKGAIADLDKALAIDPTADTYLWRARLYDGVGDKDKALADILAARKIDTASSGAINQLANLYADRGEKDKAIALLDERVAAGGKDKTSYMAMKAEIQGKDGEKNAAITTIDAAIAASPGNPNLLNSRCWLKGTMNVMLDTALKDCTKSIELADAPGPALDSRAMVYFRMNRMDDALTDLDAALDVDPDRAPSIFMRGIIRKRAGDAKAGDADIAAAVMMAPRIEQTYAKYGIAP